MAEVKSTQTTAIAAGYKVLPSADGGRKRGFYAEYVNGASGQLRTRFQAFVESIEIKKLQEAGTR